MEDARLAVESKIETFTRLRRVYGGIYDMFNPDSQVGDRRLQTEYAQYPDPIMEYVRDNYAEGGGPDELVQYRALKSEMHAAAKRSNPFGVMPWPCKIDCAICMAEARCLASDQCSICPHALLDGGMEKAVLPAPPAAAGIAPTLAAASSKPLHALTNTAVIPTAVPASAKPVSTLTTNAAVAPASTESTLVISATAVTPGATDVTTAANSLALAAVPVPPRCHGCSPSTAIVAIPPVSSPPAFAPPEIGSDAWKALPEDDRIRQLRMLYDTLGTTGLDIRGMVRNYLKKIAPLERNYFRGVKRGYRYRDSRYAGARQQDSWNQLLCKEYEPILCCVLDCMDVNDVDVWAAADAIENVRVQSCGGNWKDLIAVAEVKRFHDGRGSHQVREPYLKRLQAQEFADAALAASVAAIASPEPEPAASEGDTEGFADEMDVVDAPLAAPAIENAVTRILALDPAISCGFSILQLDAAGQILSVDVGVIDVSDKTLTSDGARCNSLQEQVRTLLSPVPDHVCLEPYFGHGRQGDAISFKLRAAIEMQIAALDIEYTEVAPQTWKKTIAKGNADKPTIRTAIEQSMGFHFPMNLFIRGRWLKFRDDASDATGIALHAVKEVCGSISFAASLIVQAPGKPKPRPGKPLEAAPVELHATVAPAAADAAPALLESAVIESPPRDAALPTPSRSGRQPKRKERYEPDIDSPASAYRSTPQPPRKSSFDPSLDPMSVPDFAIPGAEVYAMGFHAGVRKRFRARVDSLRAQRPPIVVTYTASEDGAGRSALELPEMRTAYVTAADVAMRDWI